jgi:hypothetical protein
VLPTDASTVSLTYVNQGVAALHAKSTHSGASISLVPMYATTDSGRWPVLALLAATTRASSP